MVPYLSRRHFLGAAAAAACAGKLSGDTTPAAPAANGPRSAVGLVNGPQRRTIVREALEAVEDQLLPGLRARKHVVIKPNIVNPQNPLASTHVDALHGILDFLERRFKGPVVVAESSAGDTTAGFENLRYKELIAEHKTLQVGLVDLNEEGKYETHTILNGDLHAVPVRLAARLVDPEAFVICSAIMKTHNTVVATMALKNMALGAPLHSGRKEKNGWNDKRLYHGGVRQTHVDIMLTCQRLRPSWGAAVIDGFEGMEGNGPNDGTAVPSRVAIASADFVAADRVGLAAMGIEAAWVGYLGFCAQAGLGQADLARIELRGTKLAEVARKYKMHDDIGRELRWMGPMKEVPEKLG